MHLNGVIMHKNFLFPLLLLFHSVCFSQYYSQCEQDKFINENFFKNQKNGVFVDIGAHDGISFSNTYFFEKELNWTGICIEPIPEVFAKLKRNRKCICAQGCAATETKKSEFLKISGPLEMLSGLVSKYSTQHKERIQREILEYGGACERIQVQCYNVNELFEKYGITHINFLSLDTEGGEFEILRSINFSEYQIDVIAVENNYALPYFNYYLEQQGFKHVKSLEQDLIFVNENFKNNYEN